VSELRLAFAACPPGDLLPGREAARWSAGQRLGLVDAWHLGPVPGGASGWLLIAAPHTGAAPQPDGDLLGIPAVLHRHGLRRARPGDGVAAAFLTAADEGAFRVSRTTGARPAAASTGPTPERAVTVDQTNESVVVDESVVVKWQRQVTASPAPARLGALARAARSASQQGPALTPRVHAIATWHDQLLATVVDFLPGAEDGWTWAVDLVGAHVRGQAPEPAAVLTDLAGMVASMHLAFAGEGVTWVSGETIKGWLEEARADLAGALQVTGGPEGDRLARFAPLIRADLDRISAVERTPVIACHGDLHIGQVLAADGRLWLTDFDGNPVSAPGQRLLPQPAARDVATMLASLDHVGRVVLRRNPGTEAAVRRWIASAHRRWLDTYREVLTTAGQRDLLDDRLLLPLVIAAECREYRYAAAFLPHWVYAPDGALGDRYGEPAGGG